MFAAPLRHYVAARPDAMYLAGDALHSCHVAKTEELEEKNKQLEEKNEQLEKENVELRKTV